MKWCFSVNKKGYKAANLTKAGNPHFNAHLSIYEWAIYPTEAGTENTRNNDKIRIYYTAIPRTKEKRYNVQMRDDFDSRFSIICYTCLCQYETKGNNPVKKDSIQASNPHFMHNLIICESQSKIFSMALEDLRTQTDGQEQILTPPPYKQKQAYKYFHIPLPFKYLTKR